MFSRIAVSFRNVAKYARFTDRARRIYRQAFKESSTIPERDLIHFIANQSGVAHHVLVRAAINLEKLAADGPIVERDELAIAAREEAHRRQDNYIGDEHLLLALARRPESGLPACNASADHLDDELSRFFLECKLAQVPVSERVLRGIRAAWSSIRHRKK